MGNSGPNYGIVSILTFDGTNVPFGGSQFPFIQDSMTFTFSGATGISESQIGSVQVLFGTDGTGNITTNKIPEPATWMLMALALGSLGFRRVA